MYTRRKNNWTAYIREVFARRAGTECARKTVSRETYLITEYKKWENCNRESAKDEMIRAAKWHTTKGRAAVMISEGGGKRFPLILLPAKKRQVTDRKNVFQMCIFYLHQVKKSIFHFTLLFTTFWRNKQINKKKNSSPFHEKKTWLRVKFIFLETRIVLSFHVTCASQSISTRKCTQVSMWEGKHNIPFFLIIICFNNDSFKKRH